MSLKLSVGKLITLKFYSMQSAVRINEIEGMVPVRIADNKEKLPDND